MVHKSFVKKASDSVTHVLSGDDLADMQLIRKYNKGFRFLLSVIDFFSKYALAVSLKKR